MRVRPAREDNKQQGGDRPSLASGKNLLFCSIEIFDYILKIRIVPDTTESPTHPPVSKHRVRVPEYSSDDTVIVNHDHNSEDEAALETTTSSDGSDIDENVRYKGEEETGADGDGNASNNPAINSTAGSTAERERLCYVGSTLLKAKSQYFYYLFEDAEQISQERVVTLHNIRASEEDALIELLKFMHGIPTPSISNPSKLASLLAVAEKFDVTSCVKYCSEKLQKRYTKLGSELLSLPLAAVEVLLSSDHLEVETEDEVFGYALIWAAINYKEKVRWQEILDAHLGPLIRFAYMSVEKLEQACEYSDTTFGRYFIEPAVEWASWYKNNLPSVIWRDFEMLESYMQLAERVYLYKPIKAFYGNPHYKPCVVFLSFTRDQCIRLSETSPVRTERFPFDGGWLFLRAACTSIGARRCFGLTVGVESAPKGKGKLYMCTAGLRREEGDVPVIQHAWAAQLRPEAGEDAYEDLFDMSWDEFMRADSPCFAEGMLHLVVEIDTIELPKFRFPRQVR